MPSQAETIQALRNASGGQDLAVPPPQSPANVAPFGNAMASALGLPDALKALRGQMTPEEGQAFALTSAMGLLPGAKAESAAAKTIGSIFPKLFGKSSFAGLSPTEYMNKFGGPEAFAKQFPHTFSDLQPHLPQAAKAPGLYAQAPEYFDNYAKHGLAGKMTGPELAASMEQMQAQGTALPPDFPGQGIKPYQPKATSVLDPQVAGSPSVPLTKASPVSPPYSLKPTNNSGDYFVHAPSGAKIAELTSMGASGAHPSGQWHLGMTGSQFSKAVFSPEEGLQAASALHQKMWNNPIEDTDIDKALAKNPGASIFDVAGTNIEGPSAAWPKKAAPIGEPNPQVDIKNLTPEDEAARQQRMQQDYPTRLYHGVKPGEAWKGPSVAANNDRFYMAENPELANMYAGVNPGNKAPYGIGQVVPVQADTSKFHVFDAKGTPASSGEQWAQVNNDAIREARGVGAPGVTIKNVFDEPESTKYLGQPQNIHILLDRDWNQNQDKFPLRSPFAMFDPTQYSTNNLLAGLAGGAVAAPAVTPQVQDYIKALQGGQDQQQ